MKLSLIVILSLLSTALLGQVPFDDLEIQAWNSGHQVTSSGPNTYYDITTSHDGSVTMSTALWGTVTVAQAGTATKIRLFINVFGGPCNVKVALYNAAGTSLLASAPAQSTTANGYNEYTFTSPVAVTATTYFIAIMADTGNSECDRLSGQASGTTKKDNTSLLYALFPPAILPSSDAQTIALTAGLFVQ